MSNKYKYKLSVIIPVYNNENELREAVQPLLSYDETDYEIIFINDGSEDNSELVMKEIKEENPRIPVVIYSQTNQGVSAARNKGIELSQGKYIFFCDGDDLLDETFVERILEETGSNSDFIFWKHSIRRPNGMQHLSYEEPEIDSQGRVLDKDIFWDYLMRDKFRLCMGTYAVKKDLLINRNLFFTVGCRYGEDLEFIFKVIMNAESMQYIPLELYTYVRRESSAMARFTLKRFDAPQMVLRLLKYIDDNEINVADFNKEYLENEYFAKQFIYSMEFCHQFLKVSDYHSFWSQLRKEYPDLLLEGERVIRKMPLEDMGYSKKRMKLMKWNIYVYSFSIMLKNSLMRKR